MSTEENKARVHRFYEEVPTWTLVGAALFLAIIPRGKVFGEVLQQALAQKRVIVELRAAFSDRVIRACWLYEYLILLVVLTLMVIKPF